MRVQIPEGTEWITLEFEEGRFYTFPTSTGALCTDRDGNVVAQLLELADATVAFQAFRPLQRIDLVSVFQYLTDEIVF